MATAVAMVVAVAAQAVVVAAPVVIVTQKAIGALARGREDLAARRAATTPVGTLWHSR